MGPFWSATGFLLCGGERADRSFILIAVGYLSPSYRAPVLVKKRLSEVSNNIVHIEF